MLKPGCGVGVFVFDRCVTRGSNGQPLKSNSILMAFLSDDHRMLVEPACGAALACVYERLFKAWQDQGKLGELKSTLVIVCGGNLVSMKAMKEWKDKLGLN